MSDPEGEIPTVNETRDALLRSVREYAQTILTRDAVVEKWCAEHGKDKNGLTIEDVLTIRSLPEWKNAGS